jgi:hypothetical protein
MEFIIKIGLRDEQIEKRVSLGRGGGGASLMHFS